MYIFISYSSNDRDLVDSLKDDLEALGHRLWFDVELTRAGGHKWWSSILENLRECDVFIFGLTPTSLTSEACRREYSYAHALHKRIVPVMLKTVDIPTLPPVLQEIQWIDYRERSAKQGVALAATLSNLPAAHPLPDQLPPEPEIPLSPLAQLSERLDAPALGSQEQAEIFLRLESLFNDSVTRSSAEVLLRTLYNREDLTYRVGDKIQVIMPNIKVRQPTLPLPQVQISEPTTIAQKNEPGIRPQFPPGHEELYYNVMQSGYLYLIVTIAFLLLCPSFSPEQTSKGTFYFSIPAFVLSVAGGRGIMRQKKLGAYALIFGILLGAATIASLAKGDINIFILSVLVGGVSFLLIFGDKLRLLN